MKCSKCGTETESKFCPNCGQDTTPRLNEQVDNPGPQISNQNYQQKPSKKLTQMTWFVVIFLIFVFPVGLYCMWKNKKFSQSARIIITIIIALLVLSVFYSKATKDSRSHASSNDTPIAQQESTAAEVVAKATTAEVVAKTTAATKEASKQTVASVSTEYKNALAKAKTYSQTMYMSKRGLYDQLTSQYGEKFSSEAAQYAIDNVNADWNGNALKKATQYQSKNMSSSAIYDQLISDYGEKFTSDEATYAIQHLK